MVWKGWSNIKYSDKFDSVFTAKMWKGWKKAKFEEELDPNFAEKIAQMPGCDRIYNCIQCGTCSGTCPMSVYMEYAPRKIIGMIRAGFKGEVLSSYTTWLCASCYSCTARCPKGIKITDVMYALKRFAIKEKMAPSKLPIPVLANEFFETVQKYGRNNEGMVVMKMYFKTNPTLPIRNLIMGIKLFIRGRMDVIQDKIVNRAQLHKILKSVGSGH
ncbi:MAG: 4Fe-4S dicluster domain-containing protein [bacterium]|nr:4Fe-4S dicluster domain-containing protein [bacterium]